MSAKNGKMKLNKKGGLVDYRYYTDHSIVSQLNKCLKFKSVQGDKDHCTLEKITPPPKNKNAMNFRNLSSCGTGINHLKYNRDHWIARNE